MNRERHFLIFTAVLIIHAHGSVINRALLSTNEDQDNSWGQELLLQLLKEWASDIKAELPWCLYNEHCSCNKEKTPNQCQEDYDSSLSFYECESSSTTQLTLRDTQVESGRHGSKGKQYPRHGYLHCCVNNFTSIRWFENTTSSGFKLQPLEILGDDRTLLDDNQSLLLTGSPVNEGQFICEAENDQMSKKMERIFEVHIVSPEIAPSMLLGDEEFRCDSDWEDWCSCKEKNYANNCSSTTNPSFYHNCDDSPATLVLLEEGNQRSDYIRCCALNYSTITWFENTGGSEYTWQPVDGSKLVDKNQSVQVFGNKTYEGHYRCEVDNMETHQSINLTVRLQLTENPNCHKEPTIPGPNHTTRHQFPGEHFTYECIADIGQCDEQLTFSQMFWIFWHKNGSFDMIGDDSRENVYSVQINRSVNHNIRMASTLHIQSVRNNNYGNYLCIVANLLGSNNVTITLNYGCDVCKKDVFIFQAGGITLAAASVVLLAVFLALGVLRFTHRWDLNVKNWWYSASAHKDDQETKLLVVTNDEDDDRDAFNFAQHFTSKLREIMSADCKSVKPDGNPEAGNVQEPLQDHKSCKHFSVQLLKTNAGESTFSAFGIAAAENDFVIYLVSQKDLEPHPATSLHTFFEADIQNRFIGSIFVMYKCNVKKLTLDEHTSTRIVRALKDAVEANSFTNCALSWPDNDQNDHMVNCQEDVCSESLEKTRKQRIFWKQLKYKLMKGRQYDGENNEQQQNLNQANNGGQKEVNHRDQNEVSNSGQNEVNHRDHNEGLNQFNDGPQAPVQRSTYRHQDSGGSVSSSRPLLSQTSTDSGAEVNGGEVSYLGGPDAQLHAIPEDGNVFS